MQLNRSTLLVGEGRLSGANQVGDSIRFFIDDSGMIVRRNMQANSRGITREQFASYADEYIQTQNFAVSMYGDELEVARLPSP